MMWLVHRLIVLLYGVAAAALALGLYRVLLEVDPPLAYGAGAIGFLLAALVHKTVARAVGRRGMRRALAALDEAQSLIADKLVALDSDITRLAEALERGGLNENSAELVSEMGVMRGSWPSSAHGPAAARPSRQVVRALPRRRSSMKLNQCR